MTHHLFKSWPVEFEAVAGGMKHHEVRDVSDRQHAVHTGDHVTLYEWDPCREVYTGRWIHCLVLWVTEPTVFYAPCGLVRRNPIGDQTQVFTIQPGEVGRDPAAAQAEAEVPA